jgi:hypothetical protein
MIGSCRGHYGGMGFALFSRLIGLTSDGVTMVQAIMAIRVLFCMCSSLQGSSLGPLLLGLWRVSVGHVFLSSQNKVGLVFADILYGHIIFAEIAGISSLSVGIQRKILYFQTDPVFTATIID